jgi:dihydroorotate dehydrogenase (NAD+) catalytic subunit
MAAGARAVAFGTVNYVDPMALPRALADLTAFLEENEITDVNDLVGLAHDDQDAALCLSDKVA